MTEMNRWTLDEVKNMVGTGGGGVVIPVNKEVKAEQKILNFWYVEELLKKSKIIAVGECPCRQKLQNCNFTLEGCLFLNDWGERAIKEGYAKESNFQDALAILKKTYDEGLVLTAGSEDPPVKICSCCSCCCFMFAGELQFGLKDTLLNSAFVARVNGDLCKSCGTCVKRCHFGAMVETDGKVTFTQEKCFGCGLCVGKCPNEAVELVKR